MKKALKKKNKGFTLIELIIVIAIIAILAAVAIPNFIGLQNQAVMAKDKGNATAIVTAINAYNAINPATKIASLTTSNVASVATTLAAYWPKGMTDTDRDLAVGYVAFVDGVATVSASAAASASPS